MEISQKKIEIYQSKREVMMFPFKRKHKIKPLKGYIPLKGFYQELNILQTDSGFSKLFKVKEI